MRRRLAFPALLAVAFAAPLAAQGYRLRLDSRVQGVSWRGLELDSIPFTSAVANGHGGYETPDGLEARCLGAQCLYFRAGAVQRGMPWVTQADASLWGFGLPGLSARVNARLSEDLGKDATWPGSEPAVQLYEAYLEYATTALTARAGRQFLTGRLGSYGLDGGRVTYRVPTLGLEAGAYLGWGLARGTALVVTDPALNPLDDFQPRDRQVAAGAELAWNGRFADARAEYRREVDPAVHYFVSERASVAATLRPIARLRVSADAVYDMAFGQFGSADATASWVSRLVTVSAGARRYRPLFDLWTIWGAFSPAGYEAMHGSVDVTPVRSVIVHVRGEKYRFDDTETSTPLVDVEDHGWRYDASITWMPDARWTLVAGHPAEFGPGASSLGYDGRVTWEPTSRIAVSAHASRLRRPLELRFSDATLTAFGGDVTLRPDDRWRLDLGASRVREDRDRPDAAAIDWDQWRITARMSWVIGSSADRLPLPRALPTGGNR